MPSRPRRRRSAVQPAPVLTAMTTDQAEEDPMATADPQGEPMATPPPTPRPLTITGGGAVICTCGYSCACSDRAAAERVRWQHALRAHAPWNSRPSRRERPVSPPRRHGT